MKNILMIVYLVLVVIVVIALFSLLRIPITTATATLMVAIGTLISAIVSIFSIRETRALAGLSIYPNLRIGSITGQPPDQVFSNGNMCTPYVYLENLGPGIAKDIELVLTEYGLQEGLDDRGYMNPDDLIAIDKLKPRKATKDFLAPNQTIETPYTMPKESFRTWFLFSPFNTQIPAFLIENEGYVRFFILTVSCKNMRNEKIKPVSYLLQGLPTEYKIPDYAKKWLCWRVYLDKF